MGATVGFDAGVVSAAFGALPPHPAANRASAANAILILGTVCELTVTSCHLTGN